MAVFPKLVDPEEIFKCLKMSGQPFRAPYSFCRTFLGRENIFIEFSLQSTFLSINIKKLTCPIIILSSYQTLKINICTTFHMITYSAPPMILYVLVLMPRCNAKVNPLPMHGSTLKDRINTKSIFNETNLLSANQTDAQIKLFGVWKAQNNKSYPIQWLNRKDEKKRGPKSQ